MATVENDGRTDWAEIWLAGWLYWLYWLGGLGTMAVTDVRVMEERSR